MDDDSLEPKDLEDEEVEDEVDDILTPGKKKPKKAEEDDSLDALADEEEQLTPSETQQRSLLSISKRR